MSQIANSRPVIQKSKSEMTVTVKCVNCNRRRDIKANDVPTGEQPMCDHCLSPMVPVKAQRHTKN